jgi:hypothetical protein
MRERLLTRIFYNFTEAEILSSSDLHADGFLDSLSVLAILGLFDEEFGEGVALKQASVVDTASLEAIENFYLRLGRRPSDQRATGSDAPIQVAQQHVERELAHKSRRQ